MQKRTGPIEFSAYVYRPKRLYRYTIDVVVSRWKSLHKITGGFTIYTEVPVAYDWFTNHFR